MTTAVSLVVALSGGVIAGFATYLLVLALAALRHREGESADTPASTRLCVLIPAHDEAELIARCVSSLRAQSHPRERYEIVVVADNCTDDTAAVARRAGADAVLERRDPDARGKGRALRWAMDERLARDDAPEAIVVVDADTTADANLLACLASAHRSGAQAVQSAYVLEPDASPRSALRAAAFLLFNRARPAGRGALGLSVSLTGNGMLLSRELLRTVPWEAFTATEDLEYSLDLAAAGIAIAFAGGACVRAPTAPSAQAAATQQLRWEGGRAHLVRTRAPGLIAAAVAQRRATLLLVALDLVTPPLGTLAALALAGLAAGGVLTVAGVCSAWSLLPWLEAVAALPAYVLVGLAAAHAPRSAYRALLRAPQLILAKPLQLRRVLAFRPDSWVRTERATDGSSPRP